MSNIWEEYPTFWTHEDSMKAERAGWDWEEAHSMDFEGGQHVGRTIRTINMGWHITWRNPVICNHGWDDDPVTYVAESAAAGYPLAAKAWLLYCKLDFDGRIFRPSVTSYGDTIT